MKDAYVRRKRSIDDVCDIQRAAQVEKQSIFAVLVATMAVSVCTEHWLTRFTLAGVLFFVLNIHQADLT